MFQTTQNIFVSHVSAQFAELKLGDLEEPTDSVFTFEISLKLFIKKTIFLFHCILHQFQLHIFHVLFYVLSSLPIYRIC